MQCNGNQHNNDKHGTQYNINKHGIQHHGTQNKNIKRNTHIKPQNFQNNNRNQNP